MFYRTAKLVCILALSVISIFAIRYGVAEFYFERAKRTYNSLILDELNYSHELDHILADLDKSLELRGNSANTLDLKADLLYQSWVLSPDGQYLGQSELLQDAVELHLDALGLRDGWSFTVARLALIHSHQAALDINFGDWFSEAYDLGLYETSIARSLMTVGFINWERLTDTQKNLTTDFAYVSIEQKTNSPKLMMRVLNNFGKRSEVCLGRAHSPRILEVCAGLGIAIH